MAAGAMAAANARTSSLEARQAMGGDDPAPPTPTFEPVRRPSLAYGLPRGNLAAGGCRQGGRERARVSEQTRTARSGCAQRGRPGLPPGTQQASALHLEHCSSTYPPPGQRYTKFVSRKRTINSIIIISVSGGAIALPHAALPHASAAPPAQERRSRSWCARLQIS